MPKSRHPKSDRGPVKATREDWLRAALRVLVTEGVNQVLILPLANKLKVSRSSFYWYFKDREDLLNQLLAHWMSTNTRAIVEHAERDSETVIDGVLNIFECWVDESLYDPRFDFAVRNWARQSARVRRLMEKADDKRLAAIKRMFQRHGSDEEDAFIRARVLYYMQIGYYVLDIKEPMEARLSHLDAYLRTFTGHEATPAQIRRFTNYAAQRSGRGTVKVRFTSSEKALPA